MPNPTTVTRLLYYLSARSTSISIPQPVPGKLKARTSATSQFEPYGREFYETKCNGSLQSAKIVIPILLKHFQVTSVVDIGCGIGTWLKVFKEHGVSDILGVDGEHIDDAMLLIEKNAFVAVDLCTHFSLERRYDLAISLEVAEHLPEAHAAAFVQDLTNTAPLVLFSAAVPGQGGEGHINMKWQDYWRRIFAKYSYMALDIIRPAIWGKDDVEFWYQQNTILYCDTSVIAARPDLVCRSEDLSLNLIHPALYEPMRRASELTLRRAISSIPGLTTRALQRRLHRWIPVRRQ
jgi:SAM-dependent methyltransferase